MPSNESERVRLVATPPPMATVAWPCDPTMQPARSSSSVPGPVPALATKALSHRRRISFDLEAERAETERNERAARSARSHHHGEHVGVRSQRARSAGRAAEGSNGGIGDAVAGVNSEPLAGMARPPEVKVGNYVEQQQPVERANERSEGGEAREQESRHEVDSAGAAGGNPAAVPMSNYAFFVKYTYSNECALLAYNFHELVSKLGIFEHFAYKHDYRLISVTLAYIFYRYQVHHCDMALDLAVTLVYLEDVRASPQTEWKDHNRDAFNLICYLAFLAHTFNADRTIRLSDWYKEIGWRSFKNCQQLNSYVFFLFSTVRQYRLRVSEARVKRYIQKLCSVPNQIQRGPAP